jgi:hypothetical protein
MTPSNGFRECLLSSEPSLLDLPAEFPMPADPVFWAHSVCSNHPEDIRAQAMPQTVGVKADDPGRALTLAADAAPELVRNVLTGISKGAAAHASMELWHADSFAERVADPAAVPFKKFVADTFESRLRELHPFGHHTKLTLWFSADQHVYDAHCDVADGVLFQLTGKKVVEVWPVPAERGQRALFNHAYRFSPMTTPGKRFTISPGQALFIPAGAMHEVVVASDQVSVSMSLHAGAPFPILEMCRDLSHMSGQGEPIGLPEEMMHRDKFRVAYFDPAMFHGEGPEKRMPDVLRSALLDTLLRPRGYTRERLSGLLDHWWRLALSTPCYPGPDLPPEDLGRAATVDTGGSSGQRC